MENKINRSIRQIFNSNNFIWLSLFVFAISLTQNAYIVADYEGDGIYSSISVFLIGGIAILGGGLFEWFVWLANPLYILTILLIKNKRKISFITSLTATVIAFSFSYWNEILVSENGRNAEIVSFELGYWLWYSSLSIMTIGSYFKCYNNNIEHSVTIDSK